MNELLHWLISFVPDVAILFIAWIWMQLSDVTQERIAYAVCFIFAGLAIYIFSAARFGEECPYNPHT